MPACATHWGSQVRNDISSGMRELIDRGTAPVTASEARQRAAVPRARPRLRGRPGWIAAAAGVAAVSCAAALGVSQLAAPGGRRGEVILTAATVRRIASASRSAMAFSGQAIIRYADTQNGTLQDSGSDDISFSGKNWNDALRQLLPAAGGQAASTQFAINRIVNGQFYLYIKGRTSRLEWYRDTNPSGHPSFTIPDPRTLLGVLRPSAGFEPAGYQTIGGLRLLRLRATHTSHLPLTSLPDLQPGEHITALQVWVDRHSVVHQMAIAAQQTQRVVEFRTGQIIPSKLPKGFKMIIRKPGQRISFWRLRDAVEIIKSRRGGRPSMVIIVGPARAARGSARLERLATSLTVSFLDIGTRQVITAPARAIPQYGRG